MKDALFYISSSTEIYNMARGELIDYKGEMNRWRNVDDAPQEEVDEFVAD